MSEPTNYLPAGKLSMSGFAGSISPFFGAHREEVTTGPAFGVDVAVIELPGDLALAMTSDPLSLIPSLGLRESAWLSVHLMANDMATTGFAPMYGQFVLNLPPDLPENDFKEYWQFIHRYCADIGVSITGGHTGSIEGQHSTIAGGGTMVLTAPRKHIRLSHMAQQGDLVLVTKEAAISAAAILAMSFPETVRNKLGHEVYHAASDGFSRTSSLQDGLIAAGVLNEVTAMHDVTEGGVLGAVYELAAASGKGVRIWNEKLPVAEPQKSICALFGIDPRFSIGAGAMIITAGPEHVPAIMNRLQENNIPVTVIGEITDPENGCLLITDGVPALLPYYPRDPYWEAFFRAYQNGLK